MSTHSGVQLIAKLCLTNIYHIYIDVGWVYSVVYLELLLGFKVNQLIFLMRLISPVQPSQGQNEGFTFGARCPGAPLTMHLGVGALCSPWILCCILGEERDFIGFYMVLYVLKGFMRILEGCSPSSAPPGNISCNQAMRSCIQTSSGPNLPSGGPRMRYKPIPLILNIRWMVPNMYQIYVNPLIHHGFSGGV